ncbi:helix-turn-helix domain-containing protein [uncultured Clostridium sp.]|uniref:helix-turn-helix domain-containing protein n=1 Tax=uncultured Clostridium sp. TaxID=59620 RepID=UPI00280B5102|nr:helix-turn-helix domain-containing protein [uncultured Clostridium sp.]MDU1348306.1 helix-turn-helix domain-containing protein [Clostridium argentinense]
MSLAENLLEYEKTVSLIKQENEDLKSRVAFLENMISITLKKQQAPELFTVSEVAEKLKTNRNTVYDLISKGYLKSLKLGSQKVSIDELQNFIERFKGKEVL